MTRCAGLAALVAAVALLVPPAALAAPLLTGGDDAELAQALAEAHAEQGVCYGYLVVVDDENGIEGGVEQGSHLGPGRPLDTTACTRSVRLTGRITYTCDSCESEDSSSAVVGSSGLREPITLADVEALGLDDDRLKDDDGDEVLIDMVEALPFLVASKGEAAPVPAELGQPGPPPNGDRPTDRPSSDAVRNATGFLVIATTLVVVGLGWFVLTFRDARRALADAFGR